MLASERMRTVSGFDGGGGIGAVGVGDGRWRDEEFDDDDNGEEDEGEAAGATRGGGGGGAAARGPSSRHRVVGTGRFL